jgi:hypothetical protein
LQIEEIKVDGERRMSVQKKAVEVKVILVHTANLKLTISTSK